MRSDLEVDTEALRGCAPPVHALADAVAAAAVPGSVLVPRWDTSEAAAAMSEAARVRGRLLAGDLDRAADRLTTTAHDYEQADEQVAGRLRAVR
ncbi:hypothetical protein [Actinoplanes sp. NPDC049265]|uniref:hypothetical protein n=1 Tax=Actinoplanes sp. NPDC049265 TaxID=3363902 RepID=UPI003720CF8D